MTARFCSKCEYLGNNTGLAGQVRVYSIKAANRAGRPTCEHPDNTTPGVEKSWFDEKDVVKYQFGPHKRNIDNDCELWEKFVPPPLPEPEPEEE